MSISDDELAELSRLYGEAGGRRIAKLESALTSEREARLAAEKRVDELEQLVCDFQAASMLTVGSDDPAGVTPAHVEREITSLRAALERIAEMYHADTCSHELVTETKCNCHIAAAREALSGKEVE